MGKCRECFTRARRPEEIAQRRQEIVAAAARLLDQQPLDQISLNGIAREAGLAKSAVYRYFESREAIFLQILERDFRHWVDEVEYALGKLRGCNDAALVSGALVAATVRQPRLCHLVSRLASVLEQNLSEQAVLAFKQQSVDLAMRMVVALSGALPAVPTEQWAEFVNPAIALIAGLWPLSHPSETVTRVMQRPEFRAFAPDFERQLRRTLHMALLGMQQQGQAGSPG